MCYVSGLIRKAVVVIGDKVGPLSSVVLSQGSTTSKNTQTVLLLSVLSLNSATTCIWYFPGFVARVGFAVTLTVPGGWLSVKYGKASVDVTPLGR